MEKQQHTPGPWAYIVPDGHVVRHPQIYSDFGPVANATWLGENKLDQLKANARLIATAPELLEALELLVDNPYREGTESDERLRRIARAAIANATGG